MSAGKSNGWVSLLCVLTVIGLLVAACAPAPATEVPKQTEIVEPTAAATEESPSPEAEGPAYGGVLVYATQEVAPNLDGQVSVTDATMEIALHIFECLVEFGEDYSITPMLAESWDISDDGKTYTFHLRHGRKFHNGEEMTSEDVIASMDRYLQVSTRAGAFEVLESYEATDDYTVVMHLSTPTAVWLDTLAQPTSSVHIFPKEVIERQGTELLKPENAIGTGPYQLVEYKPDQIVRLKRFEDYEPLAGARNGLGGAKIPYFDEIHFIPVPELGARLAGLETGDYDFIQGVPGGQVEAITSNPDLQIQLVRPHTAMELMFNHAAEFTSDVNFRQAILAALDMEAIALASVQGNQELVSIEASLWPAETAWHIEDTSATAKYNQKDLARAQELLAEAGYNGEEIVLMTAPEQTQPTASAMEAADQLTKLGVNVKVETLDWPGLIAKLGETTGWHMTFGGFSTPNIVNPNNWIAYWHSSSTSVANCHYGSDLMDAALDALGAARDFEERKEGLREVQRAYYEDLPFIQTHQLYMTHASRASIQDFNGWLYSRFFGVWRQS